MGKIKFKRLKALRHNPVGLPSTEEVKDIQTAEDIRSDKKLPVLSQLTSGKAADRIWACYSIANLVFDQSSVHSLVTGGVSSKIASLLVDKDCAVREAAIAALINLVVAGADELKDLIINDDVTASLLTCIKECCSALEHSSAEMDSEKQSTAKRDQWIRILEYSLVCLSSMSELSQQVINMVNSQNIVPLLVTTLSLCTSSPLIVQCIVHCLLSLTEDNEVAITWLCGQKEHLSLFESLLSIDTYSDGTKTLVRALVIGIFHNLYIGISQEMKEQVLIAIVKELAGILSCDITSVLISTSPATDETIKEVESILSAQQLSLEIITNLCCEPDDNEESWEDMEEEEDSETKDEQNGAIAMEDNEASPYLQMVTKLFSQQQIPQKVVQKCSPQCNLEQLNCSARVKAQISERLHMIQCRGFTALHAVTPVVSVCDLGGEDGLAVVWNSLYLITSSKTAATSSGEGFPEAVTAAQWAVLDKIYSAKMLQCLTHEQIQWVCEGVMSPGSHDLPTMANMVRLLGVASRITAADEQQSKHEAKVKLSLFASSLKRCVESNHSLWISCEAIDVMYDVFGSSVPLAQILSITGVSDSLQHLAASFREKLKTEGPLLKQQPAHVTGLIEMVRDNLVNFIDYLKHPT